MCRFNLVAIKVKSATTSSVRWEMYPGYGITLIKFEVEFNEPVFFKKDDSPDKYPIGDSTLFSPGTIPGIDYGNLSYSQSYHAQFVPRIINVGAGTGNVRCDGLNISNYNPIIQGQPRYGSSDIELIVVPPTTDPIFTAINWGLQGPKVNETVFENRWVAGFLPMNPALPFNITSAKCVVTFPGSGGNGFRLVDSNSNPISLNATFEYKPPACNYEQMVDAMNFAASIKKKIAGIKSFNEMFQYMQFFQTLEIRESLQGCPALMKSFVELNKTLIQMPASTRCEIPYDDPTWQKDPCCNWELARTQCCKPRSRLGPAVFIQSFKNDAIAAVCKNPAKVQGLLSNFASAQVEKQKLGSEFSNPLDLWDIYEKYRLFKSECYVEIYQTRCSSNVEW